MMNNSPETAVLLPQNSPENESSIVPKRTVPVSATVHVRSEQTKRHLATSRACQTSEAYFQQQHPPATDEHSKSPSNSLNLFAVPGFGGKNGQGSAFMGKIMEDFEKKMSEQMKVLEDMSKKREVEESVRRKQAQMVHIPQELQVSALQADKVWESLFNLLEQCRQESSEGKAYERGRVESQGSGMSLALRSEEPESLILHALSSWLCTLPSEVSERASHMMHTQVCSWIRDAWRLQRPFASLKEAQEANAKKTKKKKEESTNSYHNALESHLHQHPWQGVVLACRVAMALRYGGWTRLRQEGFQALFSKPPVIYINSAAPEGMGDYIAMQLGLSVNSVYRVPLMRPFDADESMDLVALEQKINADLTAGKTPLLIFAYAGSPVCGTVDNVRSLHQLAEKHKIWLHMEGVKLSDLVLLGVPTAVFEVDRHVDSVTLSVGRWLALPNMPFSTHIVRPDAMSEVDSMSRETLQSFVTLQERLALLPLWFRLQFWGHEVIADRMKATHDIMRTMRTLVDELPSLAVVNKNTTPGVEVNLMSNNGNNNNNPSNSNNTTQTNHNTYPTSSGVTSSEQDKNASNTGPTPALTAVRSIVSSLLTMLTTWDTAAPVLVFKFVRSLEGIHKDSGREVAPYAAVSNSGTGIGSVRSAAPIHIHKPAFVSDHMTAKDRYMQALNSWLCDALREKFPEFDFQMVKLPGHRRCIRFCALEAAALCGDVGKLKERIPELQKSLQSYLRMLDTTVSERLEFRAAVQAHEDLLFLEDPNYPGLGHVLYLPEPCRGRKSLDSLNEQELSEASLLNQFIVQEHLQAHNHDLNIFTLQEWQVSQGSGNVGEDLTEAEEERMNSQLHDLKETFPAVAHFSTVTPGTEKETVVGGETQKQLSNGNEMTSDAVSITFSTSNAVPPELSPKPVETVFCVGFGLIPPSTDVAQLLHLLVQAGKTVEKERIAFMRLENLVKQGIVKANRELSKEQKMKAQQVGMLRQVPYLDSLLNWWTPTPQTPDSSKGLTLDLSRGEIKTTEDTYKYRIQLQSPSQYASATSSMDFPHPNEMPPRASNV